MKSVHIVSKIVNNCLMETLPCELNSNVTCIVLCAWWTTVHLNSKWAHQRTECPQYPHPHLWQLGHWHWHSGSGLLRDNSDHQLHIILKWFSVTFGRLVAVPAWSWLAWRSHSLMRKLISLSISMNVHSKQNRCLKCSSRWTSWKSNYITISLYLVSNKSQWCF